MNRYIKSALFCSLMYVCSTLTMVDKMDCVFSSGLSLIMMVVIRYISKVLVWILTVLVVIGSIGNFQINVPAPLPT